jgi:branched-subunit amino acid transport protein
MSHDIILIIAGAALVTYGTRFPLLIYAGPKHIPAWLKQYLGLIAPAVLTALIVPAVFIKQGRPDFTPANEYLLAAILSAVIAYFFKNTLLVVISGVLTVALLIYL